MPTASHSPAASSQGVGPLAPGTVLGGRFKVQDLLGPDAGCYLYRALDGQTQAPVLVRIVPNQTLGPHAVRFEADAQRAAALEHKNLVAILGVGREPAFAYLVTEWLDGQTLREFIDGKRAEGRGVSFKGAYNLVAHMLNGLEFVYQVMPHGALNPANVIVTRSGRVKIGALGLVSGLPHLARRGAMAGLPETLYIAPEVMGGQPISFAGDVYALGLMLYELLSGRPPLPPLRPLREILPDVPDGIDETIARALQPNPSHRWPSLAEFKAALLPLHEATAVRPSGGIPVVEAASVMTRLPSSPALAGGPAVAAPAGDRLTLGKSFDVGATASSVADEGRERWLVQKDQLDFGPFSLTQIRAQIQRGDIRSEHLIVDTDTGTRCKIKDFPPLGEFAKHAERNLERQRRAHAEHSSEKTEKRKSVVGALVVGLAVLVVAGGVGYYLFTRKAGSEATIATRTEEAEIDNFLKGVKISGKASVQRRARGGSGAGAHAASGGGANDEFNNDAVYGDARQGGSDDVLDDQVIQEVMMSHYRKLVPCIAQARSSSPGLSDVNIDFVIKGTGKVSAVKVNGQRGGAFAGCVLGRMQSFGFPKFNGSKTIASWSMSMR